MTKGSAKRRTTITIRGNGFRDDDEVWVGGRRAVDARRIDSRRVEVTTPPGEPGPAAIEVRRASGGDSARRDGAFTFDAIALDPPRGSVAGGTFVTITGYGTDFDPTTVVRFDGVLEVTDPAALAAAVRDGLGSAKAFGFGLLSLAAIPPRTTG